MSILADTLPSLIPTPDPLLALIWAHTPAQPTLAVVPATRRRT